jgi:hypothetical protein
MPLLPGRRRLGAVEATVAAGHPTPLLPMSSRQVLLPCCLTPPLSLSTLQFFPFLLRSCLSTPR